MPVPIGWDDRWGTPRTGLEHRPLSVILCIALATLPDLPVRRSFATMNALLVVGRVLIGAGFALDGGWWLFTAEVRIAYLERAGAPGFFFLPVALLYLIGGTLVAIGRLTRPAILVLIGVAGLITMMLHTDMGPGGIGEYPMDRHGPLNIEALLVQVGLVGSLMLVFGKPNQRGRAEGRATVLGRMLLGFYFASHGLYQALFYTSLTAHLREPEADPPLLVAGIVVQIVGGMMIGAGRRVPEVAGVVALLVLAWTIFVHADLTGGLQPANAQVHQWFVSGALLGGLLLLIGLGDEATPPPSRRPPAH